MNHRKTIPIIFAALAAGILPSCIFVTKVSDEPKMPVSFDSAKAAQVFYDKAYVPESSGQNMGHFGIGYTLPKFSKRQGAQLKFNNYVRAADTNSDGRISEAEAAAYADAR